MSSDPSPARIRGSSQLTPLGIIAAFVGLSEAVGGLAATQTTGAIQIVFTTFAATFPLLVATAFFTILWRKPYVLYPPQEFGAQVDVRHYVDAMRQQALGNQEVLSLVRASIVEAMSSVDTQAMVRLAKADDPEAGSAALVQKVLGHLQEAVVTVDVSSFSSEQSSPLVFPYDPEQEAFTLLSVVWFQISARVPAYTYGKTWALEDMVTGRRILPDGVDWSNSYALADSGATVEELGIAAGMRLRVVSLGDDAVKKGMKVARSRVGAA